MGFGVVTVEWSERGSLEKGLVTLSAIVDVLEGKGRFSLAETHVSGWGKAIIARKTASANPRFEKSSYFLIESTIGRSLQIIAQQYFDNDDNNSTTKTKNYNNNNNNYTKNKDGNNFDGNSASTKINKENNINGNYTDDTALTKGNNDNASNKSDTTKNNTDTDSDCNSASNQHK